MDCFTLPAIKRVGVSGTSISATRMVAWFCVNREPLGLVTGLGVGAGIFYYRSPGDWEYM